jgi:hypothetical protein
LVALFNTDHPQVAEQLLDQLPPGVMVVFKIGHPVAAAAARQRFALERFTAFISFTSDQTQCVADQRLSSGSGGDLHTHQC